MSTMIIKNIFSAIAAFFRSGFAMLASFIATAVSRVNRKIANKLRARHSADIPDYAYDEVYDDVYEDDYVDYDEDDYDEDYCEDDEFKEDDEAASARAASHNGYWAEIPRRWEVRIRGGVFDGYKGPLLGSVKWLNFVDAMPEGVEMNMMATIPAPYNVVVALDEKLENLYFCSTNGAKIDADKFVFCMLNGLWEIKGAEYLYDKTKMYEFGYAIY